MTSELVFSGDDVLIEKFPNNVDIIYPNLPLLPLENFDAAIETALDNPLSMAPLENLIDSTSRVCIGFDDISIPVPLIHSPDPRTRVIKAILSRLKNIGVSKDNISLICATGLHRKCKSKELQLLVGKQVIQEFGNQIRNHDPEEVIRLQILPSGTLVDLNKEAASSDIIIYVSIPYTPLNGGYKSVVVGMGSVENILQHHTPEVLRNSPLMDPNKSEMHQVIQSIGQIIEEKTPIFQIEVPLNNDFFSSIFRWLWKPLKGKNASFFRRTTLALTRMTPNKIKTAMRVRYRANFKPIGIFAGKVDVVHHKALELVYKQMTVKVPHHYDALLFGIPNMSPYNVGTDPNPLLIHTLTHGYLTNAFRNKSPLKEDGVIIGFNPGRNYFNQQQHAAYQYVFNQLEPKYTPSRNVELETTLKNHPQFTNAYRYNHAYHPLHSLLAYYWGTGGRYHSQKTIIITKKPIEQVMVKMEWLGVSKLDHALRKAKEALKQSNLTIAYQFIPPLSILQLER
ncbi:MAG: lactate racemase domain-containing protein [Candidatus Hodarchaeota archaeon]